MPFAENNNRPATTETLVAINPLVAGLTLRDYFAGQALAGSKWASWDSRQELNAEIARCCYAKADVMMAERRRKRR